MILKDTLSVIYRHQIEQGAPVHYFLSGFFHWAFFMSWSVSLLSYAESFEGDYSLVDSKHFHCLATSSCLAFQFRLRLIAGSYVWPSSQSSSCFLCKCYPWFQVMKECRNSLSEFTLYIEKIGPVPKTIFPF